MQTLAQNFPSEEELRKKMLENSKDAEIPYQLGCVLAANGQFEEALEQLLTAGEQDMSLARGAVREAMVAVFHLVGNQSELANNYRNKLSRLMY